MIQGNQISQYVINKYKRNNTKHLSTNNTKEQKKHKTDSAYVGQIEEMAVRQERPTITGHHHWAKQNKKKAIRPNFGRLLFTVKKRVSPHWFFSLHSATLSPLLKTLQRVQKHPGRLTRRLQHAKEVTQRPIPHIYIQHTE